MPAVSHNSLLSVEGLALLQSSNSGPRPRSISFHADPGCVVWINGPSGVGKTSILRTLARLNESSQGEVFLDGVSWRSIRPGQWRKQVIYTHQKPVLFRGTVLENFKKAFSLRCRSSERLDLELAQALLSRLLLGKNVLNQDANLLSVGEGARVALVRSILVNPRILLIDEITSALDSGSRDEVLSLLKEWVGAQRRAIVGVSHEDRVKQELAGQEILLD